MKMFTVVAAIVSLLPAGVNAAELSSGQLKLVGMYAKTLAKSRDVGERREAARGLGQIEAAEVVEPLIGAGILALDFDPDGNLWIGTIRGLIRRRHDGRTDRWFVDDPGP